ncbi:MAG: alpha/beta hydrolase fold domain-containing protein [Acidimicrobiia bacterium]
MTSTTTSITTSTTVPCDHPEPTTTNHVFATYPGVDDRFTSFDVHLPAGCGPFPVLVWVHGGAWVGGDKSNPEVFDRVTYAHSLGYALVSTNYRLANKYGKGAWPDYPDDVADAVAYIVDNGDALHLDTEYISLLGHSAGGHTVAIVTADPSYIDSRGLDDDTIDCVVANDTEGYRLEDRATAYPSAIENAFGSDPGVLADASPSVRIERDGAPATRYLVVTRGSARRQEVATEFVDLVVAAGGDAQLLVAGDYSHSEVNRVLGEPDDSVLTPTVSAFLRECLRPAVR